MKRYRRPLSGQPGFTLIEVIVSMAIALVVFGAVFSILNPAQAAFQAQPEVSAMQQRLRVVVDTLSKDMIMAGAGPYSGVAARNGGSLLNIAAPVMPYRAGALRSDPPGTFRTDTISLLYVPETAAQTTIRRAISPGNTTLEVNSEPGCPSDPLCGLEEGMQVVIADGTGATDFFVVTDAHEGVAQLQHRGLDFVHAYDPGSFVAQTAAATYYLKTDDATKTYQLMYYDGDATDAPVADNVVALSFEYFGDPQAPLLRQPGSGASGPLTTYGPRPPALGVDAGMGYPAGENCAFTVVDGQQVPRLPDLSRGVAGLVPLPGAMFADGPWCPGPASAGRYDADLLRIREIRVKVRVQAELQMLRGTGAMFMKPGTGRAGDTLVPDQELRFDVSPRNLNLGR